MPNNIVGLDRRVLDVLLQQLVARDHQASAVLVYLWLATRPSRTRPRSVKASYAALASATGLSRSAVQAAVATLKRRRLIRVKHATPTATPVYEILRPAR
ncbi:MAG: helix-turn-helix domain-containing protein [Gemmatimonadales bacterium]